MKKYCYLVLLCCLFYSVKFNAQFIAPTNSAERIGFSSTPRPSNYIFNFNPYSNYHFSNPSVFNPAMVGIEGERQLNLDWNRQFSSSPSGSYEHPMASINSAIGINYQYSSQKNFDEMHRYGVAYNYGFRWKENTQLRIGVQFSQINLLIKNIYSLPLQPDIWHNFPSLDFGLAFQFKQLRLGASVQNLIPKKFSPAEFQTGRFVTQFETESSLNLSAANTFKITKNWDWSLALLLRFNAHGNDDDFNYYSYDYGNYRFNNNQHDFSTFISFQKKYSIGATYRNQFNPVWIGFVGFKLRERLNLQFSCYRQKRSYRPIFWEALTQYQF